MRYVRDTNVKLSWGLNHMHLFAFRHNFEIYRVYTEDRNPLSELYYMISGKTFGLNVFNIKQKHHKTGECLKCRVERIEKS